MQCVYDFLRDGSLCTQFIAGGVFLVGLLFVLSKAFRFAAWCFRSFVQPPANLSKYVTGGKWAVITGGSDGIGKGFAQELAKKGVNLLLISRTASKLEEVKAELLADKAKGKVETLAVDFSNEDAQVFPAVERALRGKEVSILINNVGVNTTDIPELFLEQSAEDAALMVQVNIMSMLRLTHFLLRRMKENKNGLVINLSSFSGDFPVPMMAVYSATKAFIDNWTVAMSQEYKADKIVFMSAKPYLTSKHTQSSNMTHTRPSLTVPTARRMANCILRRVGRGISVSPYWVHNIMELVVSLMPQCIRLPVFMKNMKGVRNALLRRKAKQEENKKKD